MRGYIKQMEEPVNIPEKEERTFPRVSVPEKMQIHFSFQGDRYNLSFPKAAEFDTNDLDDLMENIDPRNLSGLIDQMAEWIKANANGYRLVIFKDIKPTTVEELLIAKTGKTLYLPSTNGSFPLDDPYPQKRIVTKEMFMQYLESTGVGAEFTDSACARYVKSKADSGVFSDVWVPILFLEYVIGYIHVWNSDAKRELFTYTVVDTLYQFSKILAHSLEINGYFKDDKLDNDPFVGDIVDISASGMLFTCPNADIFNSLLPDSNLVVNISTPQRNFNIRAGIARCFKNGPSNYIGCHFFFMTREDFSFLFECIYGKPLTDFDVSVFTGQV